MRGDPVSPEVRQAVFERDRNAVAKHFWEANGVRSQWLGDRLRLGGHAMAFILLMDGTEACPAVLVDLNQLDKCRGRWTLDHVKDEPRLGVRALSDAAHLISLCEGHTEAGMKAGHQWNTANRPALRRYLASVARGMPA